jgi:hypothetical protein
MSVDGKPNPKPCFQFLGVVAVLTAYMVLLFHFLDQYISYSFDPSIKVVAYILKKYVFIFIPLFSQVDLEQKLACYEKVGVEI